MFCRKAISVANLRTSWHTFYRPKNMVAYQKLQISDMVGMISVDGVVESVGGGGSQVPRPTWEVSRGT